MPKNGIVSKEHNPELYKELDRWLWQRYGYRLNGASCHDGMLNVGLSPSPISYGEAIIMGKSIQERFGGIYGINVVVIEGVVTCR